MHRKNLKLKEKKQSALAAVKVLESRNIQATGARIAKLMHYAPSTHLNNMLWDMCEEGLLIAEVYPLKNHGAVTCKAIFSVNYQKDEDDYDASIHNVLL